MMVALTIPSYERFEVGGARVIAFMLRTMLSIATTELASPTPLTNPTLPLLSNHAPSSLGPKR